MGYSARYLKEVCNVDLPELEPEPKGKKVNPYAPFVNEWEAEYHEVLLRTVPTGAKVWYEIITYTLVPKSETQKSVRYVPDFTVWLNGQLHSVHEVKGMWRPGAKHKVKALAAMLRPTPVYVARKGKDGVWKLELF